MRVTTVLAAACLAAATASVPAQAQDALDRVQLGGPSAVEAQQAEASPHLPIETETQESPAGSAGREILIGAITLSGLESLQPEDFAAVISPRLGQLVDDAGLRALSAAIVQEAQSRGFAFATAHIRPQRLSSGVLTVDVDEGRIDEIRISGPDNLAVREILAPLVNGAPAILADVERRLLLAGDIDGIQIRNSRYIREDDRGILLVETAHDPFAARVVLSNDGTKPLGPVQLRIEADVNGLLAAADSLSLSYTGTPAEPGELHFGWLRYAKRVSASGTELAVTGSASQARPGAYLEDLDLRSRSWSFAANILQPVWRRRSASVWLEGELGLRNLHQQRTGQTIREDRLLVARGTLYGYADAAGGRLRSSITVSRGLNALGATGSDDPLASRAYADGTFTSFYAWSDWTRSVGGAFSLRLAAQGQLASQPLLITEEASLGGTGFLRGYDWSERSGDEAIMGMAELRYDWKDALGLVRNAQFYGFVDGGSVSNIGSSVGDGSLASAGGGLRADISASVGATLEVAVPLSGPRYDTGDRAPKVNVRVATSF